MTFDLVSNPSIGIMCDSNGNRFVNGILESKQFVCDFHPLCERGFKGFEKKISKMPNTRISSKKSEFLAAAVKDFMKSLTV